MKSLQVTSLRRISKHQSFRVDDQKDYRNTICTRTKFISRSKESSKSRRQVSRSNFHVDSIEIQNAFLEA